jgi:diguanylate cyclase (GGDEF)-like protein
MKDYALILRNNIEKYNFSDLFDIHELQILQDQISEVFHVAMVILDKKGTEITNRSNFTTFCKNMQIRARKPEACFKAAFGRKKPYVSGYRIYRCDVAGVLYAIVNIRIGDVYVADWYVGQVREEGVEPDWDRIQAFGGVRLDRLKRDYSRLHQENRNSFENKVKLLVLFVKTFSQSVMQRYIQNAELERHSLLEKQMEDRNQQLIYENSFDMLTNARSRNYFYKILKELDAKEDVLPVCIVVGDVNNLKFTNDLFGHRHGDWLLTTIARIMMEEAEEDNYIVGRCGGDEFCVVMPNALRREANWYCHRVVQRLEKETSCCLPPAISFGVAKKAEMHEDLIKVMETADAKMYRNKMDFKGNYDLYGSLEELLFRKGFSNPEIVEKRISLTEGFADYLKLQGYDREGLALAVRYCDLGITIIPERLFFKEDCSGSELKEFRKAPGISAKLFLLSDKLSGFGSAVANIKENWDGSGYPRGLEEDNIHELARLFRIVNDYVLFTARKPLGKAKTFSAARRMICAGSGSFYDPCLAEAFLKFIVTVEK